MSTDDKQDYNIPKPEEWKKLMADIGKSNNGSPQYYLPHKSGWGKIFGDIEFASVDTEVDKAAAAAEADEKKHFARFQSPMAGILNKSAKVNIKPNQRYEIEFKVLTNSSTGFCAATVTFINEAGTSVGLPCSTGITLSGLAPEIFTPVTFVTHPTPEGAVKAQLALVVFGVEPNKVVEIEKVSMKKI